MKPLPLNCYKHLSELTAEIKNATPHRVSEIIYRVSYLLVFAGYGDAAYESLLHLRSGDLQLNPYCTGIKSYNTLLLNLCNALSCDSPELTGLPSMSAEELSKLIHNQDQEKRSFFLFEKDFGVCLSSELENCIKSESDEQSADSLAAWWQIEDRSFHSMNKLVNLVPIMRTLLSGILQKYIQISREQVDEFIRSIRSYTYIPQPQFIPSPSDWKELLSKWNDKVFLTSSEIDLETYADWYPDEFAQKDCTKKPASELEVLMLEQKLDKRLPPSYRNFLLSSNGWTLMESSTTLFTVQEVDWFSNLEPSLAEWEGQDISDEEYLYYGNLQERGNIRCGHMKTALQISHSSDGYCYLLNPQVVDERGEWECMDFGTKISGGYRHRSFWDMIQKFFRDGCD